MRTVFMLLAVGAWPLLACPAAAQECGDNVADGGIRASCGTADCCARCRCHAPCREKICQVVCDVKQVTKTIWACECEEYCNPLPARRTRCHDGGCGTCDRCRGLGVTCGKVRLRKKLLKKEITVEVPVYKCVVRYLCEECSSEDPAPELPPPPINQALAPLPIAPRR